MGVLRAAALPTATRRYGASPRATTASLPVSRCIACIFPLHFPRSCLLLLPWFARASAGGHLQLQYETRTERQMGHYMNTKQMFGMYVWVTDALDRLKALEARKNINDVANASD